MNKDFAVLFMVKAIELPKEYKDVINDCKAKVITYFGTRNVEDHDDTPGLRVKHELTKDDANELRGFIPDYVELAFIENIDDKFIVVDL